MSVKVSDKDMDWKRIKRELGVMANSYTKVGLQQGSKHKDPESGEMSDLVTIGAVHEFGTKRTPQRSWLRTAFDKNKGSITRVKGKVFGEVLNGRISPIAGLRLVGEFFESKVKANIVSIKTPPNSPATQRAKASKVRSKKVTEINNPLIDTGQMLQSVRHVEVM